MFSFKRSALLSAALVLGLVSGLVFFAHTSPTQAQGNQAQGSMVTCDSTLVTLLYIAEHDYGFHSMYDVSQVDKGQYGPLFESMMAMMEATPETSMMETPEASMMATPEGEMMATPEAGMTEGMTMLTPGTVAGEDQLCTNLRAELDTFFYDTFTQAMTGQGNGQ
jgi:hypothetical protein